jgi:uncharacterized membrane protein YhaH (DUF805 family)
MGGYIVLKELTSTKGRLRARPFFWQVVLCLLVIAATGYLALTQARPWQPFAATGAPGESPAGLEEGGEAD